MEWTAVRKIQPFVLLNIRTEGLDLANNRIGIIDRKAFWTSELNKTSTHSALTRLNLQSNNFYYFDGGIFDSLINLETINLCNNKLSNKHHLYMVYIPHIIINLHRLRYFFISNNKLSSLHNKWLPANLLYLDISENQIVAIHNKTFAGAPKLSVIKLSLNNIMYIRYDTFSNLGSIRLVNPGELKPCTCKYVWYLNTNSNSIVCDNSYNKYPSIREYLREDCKQHIPGIYYYIYIYIYTYIFI